MTKIDTCANCGKRGMRGDSNVGLGRTVVLDDTGLCCDCAPPTSRCDKGEPCEILRAVAWRHEDRAMLKKLRLCKHHTKLRAKKLREAKKLDEALQKAADEARARRERGMP